LSRKEFDELITKYPEVMGAFAKGKEFANTMLSMSMYELAMGKEFVERDVVTKDGIVRIKEQIPPNVRFNALKFLLENQVAEVYGKNVAKQTENDYKTLFAQMSDAEKKALMIIEKRETINTIEVRKREAPIVNEGQTIQVNNDD
jgi:tyrosyl-tRNA synthetase